MVSILHHCLIFGVHFCQLNCDAVNDGACATNNVFVSYGAGSNYAVGICKTTISGYTDWYLPSVCELGPFGSTGTDTDSNYPRKTDSQSCTVGTANIQNQLASTEIVSDFVDIWSSTEDSAVPLSGAWYQVLNFGDGRQRIDGKSSPFRGVRCVRALSL